MSVSFTAINESGKSMQSTRIRLQILPINSDVPFSTKPYLWVETNHEGTFTLSDEYIGYRISTSIADTGSSDFVPITAADLPLVLQIDTQAKIDHHRMLERHMEPEQHSAASVAPHAAFMGPNESKSNTSNNQPALPPKP